MDVLTQTQLIKIANRNNWEYGPGHLKVGSEGTAHLLLRHYANSLLLAADKREQPFRIRWGNGCKQFVEVPTGMGSEALAELRQQKSNNEEIIMSNIILPELDLIQFGNVKMGRAMLETIIEFLEDPSIRRGIVRRSDNAQLIMTESSRIMVDSGNTSEAVKRKREDYWYMSDLEEFMRESRQRLEPNNFDSWIDWSWRGFNPDTGEDWKRFTNRYRLIIDNGVLYEVCQNLNTEDCSAPR